MPNYTANYRLKKPLANEYYNIEDFNENADIIDQKLKEIEDKTQNIEVPVTSVNGKTGDVELKAEDIGAETPAGAQEKANAALAAAKGYTDQEVAKIANDLASHKVEKATLSQLGHVNHTVLTAILDTNWSGDSPPYAKTITVEGIVSTDTPIIDILMSGDYEIDEVRCEEWRYIYRAITGDNKITFYAKEKPSVELPIQVKVVR